MIKSMIMHLNSCIGIKMPAKSTLKSKTKDELIEMLAVAQHNYEVLYETYENTVKVNTEYSEKVTAIKKFIEACEKENKK